MKLRNPFFQSWQPRIFPNFAGFRYKITKIMIPEIKISSREQELDNLVVVVSRWNKLPGGIFNQAEKNYLRQQVEAEGKSVVTLNRITYQVFLFFIRKEQDPEKRLEGCRKGGAEIARSLNDQKAERVAVFDVEGNGDEALALAEGMALGSYQYLRFRKDGKKVNTLREIEIYSGFLSATIDDFDGNPGSGIISPLNLNTLVGTVSWCRDLTNTPNSHQTATSFALEVEREASQAGVSVEILNKSRLQALKMGGIMAVNRGSMEPPVFIVAEWKPANAIPAKPIVLVGKGVIYDSGGMNLKPGNSMQNMKHDMAGAAAVAATMVAAARANLPVHLVGLMPATDNRPGPNAMVSGDVITFQDGTTVEVVDTDAEGRLLLADALCYAQKYDPALVIDLATLTGSAVRALGPYGAAAMQKDAAQELGLLKQSGQQVFERVVEFPLWEEYGESLKSEIADLKNLGTPEAGLIIAAKFLEHFTRYPYIHLDIAGPAFLDKPDSYRGTGGTGFGVRLLFNFLSNLANRPSR